VVAIVLSLILTHVFVIRVTAISIVDDWMFIKDDRNGKLSYVQNTDNILEYVIFKQAGIWIVWYKTTPPIVDEIAEMKAKDKSLSGNPS